MPQHDVFEPEDASVTARVDEITGSDSVLVKGARSRADRTSNRRGLLNSSIAVQAGEQAAFDTALPIAQQEAGQIHQTNLLGRQIESSEGLAEREIGSRRELQATDIAALEQRQQSQLTSEETRQTESLASSERQSTADIASRELISENAVAAQERMAASNVASFEREKATAALATFDANYERALAALNANENIPAEERTAMLLHFSNIRDTNINLVEQLYNVKLVWESGTAA